MKIQVEVNLEDMWTDRGTVAEIARREIEDILRAHIRKAIRGQLKAEDKQLQALIKQAKKVSLEKALEQLKGL